MQSRNQVGIDLNRAKVMGEWHEGSPKEVARVSATRKFCGFVKSKGIANILYHE